MMSHISHMLCSYLLVIFVSVSMFEMIHLVSALFCWDGFLLSFYLAWDCSFIISQFNFSNGPFFLSSLVLERKEGAHLYLSVLKDLTQSFPHWSWISASSFSVPAVTTWTGPGSHHQKSVQPLVIPLSVPAVLVCVVEEHSSSGAH